MQRVVLEYTQQHLLHIPIVFRSGAAPKCLRAPDTFKAYLEFDHTNMIRSSSSLELELSMSESSRQSGNQ